MREPIKEVIHWLSPEGRAVEAFHLSLEPKSPPPFFSDEAIKARSDSNGPPNFWLVLLGVLGLLAASLFLVYLVN